MSPWLPLPGALMQIDALQSAARGRLPLWGDYSLADRKSVV